MEKEKGAKIKNEEGKERKDQEWRRKRELRLRMEKLKGGRTGISYDVEGGRGGAESSGLSE